MMGAQGIEPMPLRGNIIAMGFVHINSEDMDE